MIFFFQKGEYKMYFKSFQRIFLEIYLSDYIQDDYFYMLEKRFKYILKL